VWRPESTSAAGEVDVATVSVRYVVDSVDAAVEFYTEHLGFDLEMRPAPPFAMLRRGDLRLLLNQPGAGGGGQDAGGQTPHPGGWNRFQIEVEDLDASLAALKDAGLAVRGDILRGQGGDQVIVEDPSGNPVELFQAHPAGGG
jgi:catechol 2,3-dioxygenase-like lactoylglutathione lyase family enzyme